MRRARPSRYGVLLVGVIVSLCAPGIARAVNEPVLRGTSPAANAVVRSSAAAVVSATFDRDLSHSSTITIHDNVPTDPNESGSVALTGPQSETLGYRTVSFFTANPLQESVSPYTATVLACPTVGGCVTVSFSFAIDDTPPAPPVVIAPSPGEVRNEQPVVVQGSAESGAFVQIREGTTTIASGTADTSGDWVVPLPYPPEDGAQHHLKVYAVDHAGNISVPTDRIFVHDSVQQQPYIGTPMQGQSLPTTLVAVSGVAKAGSTVEVWESSVVLASTVAGSNQNWSVSVSFAPGSHVITATATDGWGTVDGPSEARTFVVDTTAPLAPTVASPAPGAFVATTAVTIAGSAEPSATVKVRESSLVRGAAQADATGAWSMTLSFTDGIHAITAEAVDAAGNAGPQTARAFTVDTIAPPPPTISSPASHAFLSSSSVTIAGNAEPNALVEVSIEGNPAGTVLANGAGAWSIGLLLGDGAHAATAVAIDAAGNRSAASEERVFAVDTVTPAAPVITDPANGSTLATPSVTIRGTAEQASTVRIIESSVVIGTTGAYADGNWSITLSFANGAHTITATASDAAANTSGPSAPGTFTVAFTADATPPTPPIITAPGAGSVQRADVIVSGSAEPGAVVRVREGSSTLGTTNAQPDGSWTRLVTFATGGSHTITATATDAAGNVGAPSAPRSFVVDRERPSVSFSPAQSVIMLPPVIPLILDGAAGDDYAVARVDLEIDDRVSGARVLDWTANACNGCPGSAITWQALPPLPPGVYVVNAYALDVAGNRSLPASITILVL